jgi:hypothetical protein
MRASPRPSRVARTRRSIFFVTGDTATFFFAAGQFEACRAVPRAGFGVGGGAFLDIGRLFVRYLGACGELALTVRRSVLTVGRMTDERRSAIALIAGSAGMIITMIFHPGGKIAPEQLDQVIRLNIAVHSLALASIPVLFLGAWGMSRRLDGGDRLAWAGLVLFALASIAVMNAGTLNGLVAPKLMRQIVAATPEMRGTWQMMLNYNFQINQAFARMYAVGSSLAVVLWSISILRYRTLGRGIGIYGVVLGVVTAAAICSGFLTPDRHGFAILIFGQAIWFLIVASGMWGLGPTARTSKGERGGASPSPTGAGAV